MQVVFKVKESQNGSTPRLKSRLVARGFQQKEGTDYTDNFAPVVKWCTVRFVSVIAGACRWPICHLDVKSAFFNGVISEKIYVPQPPGFIRKGFEDFVCKLNKVLYGLRQAPMAWYECIHLYLRQAGWTRCRSDPNLYVLRKYCLIVILIDD